MATNAKALTKGWIDFLKRNQIVELKSDPSGKLTYRKPVTSDDLARYLTNTAEFDEDAISKAIHMVLAKKAIGKQAPKLQNTPPQQDPSTQQKQLGAPQVKQLGSNVPVPPKKKYSNDNATDIDYKEVKEAIQDDTLGTVDEDDVEAVFNILSAPAPAAAPAAPPPEPEVDQEAELAKKTEELNQIKRMIRDTMTDAQRKALWRILTDA